jgi:FtsZ-binding cell division protein ZapB
MEVEELRAKLAKSQDEVARLNEEVKKLRSTCASMQNALAMWTGTSNT